MQPDVAKKASMRQGWRGHRGAQQGGWSPASSGCAWPRPVAGAMPCGMVPARCPKTGAMMASAGRALAYLRGPLGPRSRPWRARGSSRRAPPRGQQPGARAIGAMGMIGTGGCGWRSAPSLGPRRLGPGGGVAWLAAAPGQNARDRAASWRLGPTQCGSGNAGTPLVCVGLVAPRASPAARLGPLARGPSASARAPSADRLRCLGTTCDDTGNRGARCGEPVDQCTGRCRGQGRGGARAVCSASLARMVPA